MTDLFGGKLERDLGMERVTRNNADWALLFLDFIVRLPRGWEGTGQRMRLLAEPTIGVPDGSLNIVGATISKAIAEGLLIRTGRQEHAKLRASHARRNDIYRRA